METDTFRGMGIRTKKCSKGETFFFKDFKHQDLLTETQSDYKQTVVYLKVSLYVIGIYHTNEQYFSHALIGQLRGDQPSTIYLRAAKEKQTGFCRYIFTNKVTLWAACCSACVLYTKTIIRLTVGESGGYLARRFAAR